MYSHLFCHLNTYIIFIYKNLTSYLLNILFYISLNILYYGYIYNFKLKTEKVEFYYLNCLIYFHSLKILSYIKIINLLKI